MKRLQNSLVAKLILLLCVAMQVVAVMPHHHHGESVHLCMDSEHVSLRDADGNSRDASHSHQGFPFAVCPSHSPVVAQPDPREEEVAQTVTDHLPDCGCVHCAPKSVECISENLMAAFLSGRRRGDSAHSYLIVYLADALPCRAPDFVG